MEVVEAIEVYSQSSARYRYRVPVGVLRELHYEGSRYSAQFEVANRLWRFHLQERRVADKGGSSGGGHHTRHEDNNKKDEDGSGGTRFLALHLQSCTIGNVYAHFKLSVVCMRNPLLSVSKTFRCAFKKAGSAWGLHQFMPLHELFDVDKGYVYTVDGTGARCVDLEVTLQVLQQPPPSPPPSSREQRERSDSGARRSASHSPRQARALARSLSSSSSRRNRGDDDDDDGTRPPHRPRHHRRSNSGNSRGSPARHGQNKHYHVTAAAAARERGSAAPLSPPRDALDGGGSRRGSAGRQRSRSAQKQQQQQQRTRSMQHHRNDASRETSVTLAGGNGRGGYAPSHRRHHSNSYSHGSSSSRHARDEQGGGGAAAAAAAMMYNNRSSSGNSSSRHGGAGDALVPHSSLLESAALVYPFDRLEALCDMSFDVRGVRVRAHRCIIGARMAALLPETMLPLQVGCIVAIAVPLDVFATFLRYVYTEAYPEAHALTAEALLDLYLLCAACEFYDVCAVCVRYVQPLLTADNILPIVLTRYNAADEVLTSLYVRVLLQHYDVLIQDKQFEQMPGHLFRRLSLIQHRKESVPVASMPAVRHTLVSQLAWLADTGEYSDYEWVVGPQGYVVRAHRYVLACRSAVFASALLSRTAHNNNNNNNSSSNSNIISSSSSTATLPDWTTSEYDFSLRSWQKLLTSLYRHQLPRTTSSPYAGAALHYDVTAEDIAMVYKMHTVLGLDGQLRRAADEAIDASTALRLLICAVKHGIPELHERGIAYVASNFARLVRDDPQAWQLIGELPQAAVVSLFRTVTEHLT